MPLKLVNAGGSLTLSAVLFGAIWAVRAIRAAAERQRRHNAEYSVQNGSTMLGKYFCRLSPAAVVLLIQLQAVPHYVLDVRAPEEAAASPLPAWLAAAINLPEHLLPAALTGPCTAWHNCTAAAAAAVGGGGGGSSNGGLPPLTQQHVLVVVSSGQQQDQQAASKVAAAGFDRVAVVEGGLEVLLKHTTLTATTAAAEVSSSTAPVAVDSTSSSTQIAATSLQGLHRDALALLLDLAPLPDEAFTLGSSSSSVSLTPQQQPADSPRANLPAADGWSSEAAAAAAAGAGSDVVGHQLSDHQRLLVLDVRRHDERTLYGSIPGALHLPVDELSSALRLPAAQFRRRYHFEQPGADDVLVLQSRQSSRARWAGQLARDAGWKHVFVYLDGVCGWRLSLAVQAYPSYQQWEPPPDPEPFSPVQPDVAAGTAELQQLRLLDMLLQQHSRTHTVQ